MEQYVKDLIREDYNRLLKNETLNTTAEIERLILLQSIEGHAHNGHGAFRQQRLVDITTSDVVKALGLDREVIRAKRQALIDDIFRWAELALAGRQPDQLVNDGGKPLLGVPQLSEYKVNGSDILKGLYIGGLRDDSDVRKSVEDKYGVEIGGGTCYLVDVARMKEMGLDAEKLAHTANADKIDDYRKDGLIVDIPDDEVEEDNVKYLYIRDRLGRGHSDDMTVITAGVLYGRDVALGVWLADAIDTLEKYAVRYSDQDGDVSRLAAGASDYDSSWDEALERITLLAINPGNNDFIPDSSLRYFLLIDKDTGRCGLLSHLDFIEGLPTIPILLSHSRIKNTDFYKYVRATMQNVAPQIPGIMHKTIPDITAANLVNRNIVKVSTDYELHELLDLFTTSGAEYAIITGSNGDIEGVVSARDLLNVVWGVYKSVPAK
ncbi:MAG: CBS domain-containing protein [bacterium]|nr:CBS domain-containing protein [bacterium]